MGTVEVTNVHGHIPAAFNAWKSLENSTIRAGNTNSFNAADNTVCAKLTGVKGTYTVECSAVGRYIFIVIGQANKCMYFNEMEIYGFCDCPAGQYRLTTGSGACVACSSDKTSALGSVGSMPTCASPQTTSQDTTNLARACGSGASSCHASRKHQSW